MNALKDFKILTLLILVALGLGFEGLKRLTSSTPLQEEFGKAGEIFSIHRESTKPLEKKTVRQPKMDVQKISYEGGVTFDLKAAISNYQKEHGLEEGEAGAKKKPGTLAADSKNKKKKPQYEYVFDKRTGEWIKRRKLTPQQRRLLVEKKRRELLEKMKEAKEQTQDRQFAERSHAQDQSDFYYNQLQEQQVAQNQNNQQNNNEGGEDDHQKSYEEWARLLLTHPDGEALNQFIQAFTASQVSSEVFFRIAEDLANDPRLEMKEQALVLASSLPSVGAFRILTQLMKTEGDREFQLKAQAAMDQDYTTVAGLEVLSRILRLKNDATALFLATLQLDKAIQKLLTPGNPNLTSNFTQFVSLLTDLTEYDVSEVATQATRTLAQLKTSLGSHTVAALE